MTLTDPSGLGVIITVDCGLVSDSTSGLWRTCEYRCVEDTTVPRQTTSHGGTDDIEVPSPITFIRRNTIARWNCCEPTLRVVDHRYTSHPAPITDCSKAECLEDFKEARNKWKRSCNGLIEPTAKQVCKRAADAWYQAVIPSCNYCVRE